MQSKPAEPDYPLPPGIEPEPFISQSPITQAILTAEPWSLVGKLAVPGIIGMLLVGLKNFVDAVFVGQFVGETALAGVAIAFPLTLLLTGVASFVGTGSASLLSRAIGSGDRLTQSRVVGNSVLMGIVLSALLTLVSLVYAEQAIAFIGGRGEIAAYGVAYFRTYMWGAVFFVLGIATNMLIRAEGKMRLAMVFAGITVGVNILLNGLFVGVFGWGVEGAAVATVLAMLGYTLLNLAYFARSSVAWWPSLALELWPEILTVGGSAMLLQLMAFVQQTLVYQTVSALGADRDVAFVGASLRLFTLAAIPVFGFAQALQPVIGINYGAGKIDRLRQAYRTFAWGGTGLLLLVWLPIQLFPTVLLRLLLPETPLTPADIWHFRGMLLLLPALPMIFCGVTLFQAVGNGRLAGFLIVARQVLLFVPAIWLLPRWLGLSGVYYSLPLVDAVVLGVVLWISQRALDRLRSPQQSQSLPVQS